MDHPALKELRDIIQDNDSDNRELSLMSWISKWLYSTEKTQHVINKSILNTEEIDFVWYKVAQDCAEDLIDNSITDTTITNTSFTCKIMALRSPNGKLKENTKGTKKIKKSQ